jgi:hypothetical protein
MLFGTTYGNQPSNQYSPVRTTCQQGIECLSREQQIEFFEENFNATTSPTEETITPLIEH